MKITGAITIFGQNLAKAAPHLDALHSPFLVAASQTQFTIKAATRVKIINQGTQRMVEWQADATYVLADVLDAGAVQPGKDYYVYVREDGQVRVSLNSTWPALAGWDGNNSRKIGGFHTLCAAVGTIASHTLTDFAVSAILPNSVWCLNFRPSCSPEGMVYAGQIPNSTPLAPKGPDLWVDIYLQSGTGDSTLSANGGTITDTRVWHDHVEDFKAVGKRLLRDDEFASIAEGSNAKTNINGSADPVTTGGHSDTAGRRMISHIGCEDCCGAVWQWLLDQSYRYDLGTPTFGAEGQTVTVYHAAAPGGNPIYVKFTNDGTPYLCCNMATAAADKVLTFGTNYKVIIKHDADAATGGLPLYFDYDGTLPFRFLVNNTVHGKDCYALSNDPNFLVVLKHDASAAVNGVAVNYDDGADNRLEYISPGTANATMDLASVGPTWAYQDLGSNKGSLYRQGTYGDVKLLAGGLWSFGSYCGPCCRHAYRSRWNASSSLGSRGCAEPRRT